VPLISIKIFDRCAALIINSVYVQTVDIDFPVA